MLMQAELVWLLAAVAKGDEAEPATGDDA